ncbi:MAG: hypothetical protein MUD17_10835 [Gemmatimonadaceae bacterium]|nr:hypothetical protein [Gemmatimonadaceae bacterium]
MIVCKFGGTSVQDAEAIARTAQIIRGRLDRQPVVVVSALGGVTNELLDIANRAATGNLLVALALVESLRERHLRTVATLLDGSAERNEIEADVSAGLDELAHLAEALSTLGFITPRSLDAVAAIGELLSSRIVAAAFRHRGIAAEWVDARDVMITDEHFTRASPDTARIASAARALVRPLVQAGRVPVLGGFVGATPSRITTTLGRGGSDYSASLVGRSGPMSTACSRPIRASFPRRGSSSAFASTKLPNSPRSAPRCCIRARSRRPSIAVFPCTCSTRGAPRARAR